MWIYKAPWRTYCNVRKAVPSRNLVPALTNRSEVLVWNQGHLAKIVLCSNKRFHKKDTKNTIMNSKKAAMMTPKRKSIASPGILIKDLWDESKKRRRQRSPNVWLAQWQKQCFESCRGLGVPPKMGRLTCSFGFDLSFYYHLIWNSPFYTIRSNSLAYVNVCFMICSCGISVTWSSVFVK